MSGRGCTQAVPIQISLQITFQVQGFELTVVSKPRAAELQRISAILLKQLGSQVLSQSRERLKESSLVCVQQMPLPEIPHMQQSLEIKRLVLNERTIWLVFVRVNCPNVIISPETAVCDSGV